MCIGARARNNCKPAQSSALSGCARQIPHHSRAGLSPCRTVTVQLFTQADLKGSVPKGHFSERFEWFRHGAAVAFTSRVADSPATRTDRRSPDRRDRRKYSRSGRRARDPRSSWGRIYWLFGAYAVYLSVRKLPATLRRLLRRETVST